MSYRKSPRLGKGKRSSSAGEKKLVKIMSQNVVQTKYAVVQMTAMKRAAKTTCPVWKAFN